MQYINRNELSQLKWKTLTIKKIYGPKREWFNTKTNKMESFVYQVDKWMMRVWNPEKKNFELKEGGDVDYSVHKKKYDVVFNTGSEESIKVQKWNKDKKENYYEDVEDTDFTVQSLSFAVVWDMLAANVAFGKVPTDEEWMRVYDWEESFLSAAEETQITFDCAKAKYDINGKKWTYFEFTFARVVGDDVKEKEVEEETDEESFPF